MMEERHRMRPDAVEIALKLYYRTTRCALLMTGDLTAIKMAEKCVATISTLSPLNVEKCEELRQYLWECLHFSHWSSVRLGYREGFGLSCFLVASSLCLTAPNETETIISIADSGILMGNIVYSELLQQLIAAAGSKIRNKKNRKSGIRENIGDDNDDNGAMKRVDTKNNLDPPKRGKKSQFKVSSICYRTIQPSRRSTLSPSSNSSIPRIHQPDLLAFYQNYFLPQEPLVLTGCMEDWSALRLWNHPEYISEVAGNRTVPVEIGSSYLADDYSQKLMTVDDFLHSFLVQSDDDKDDNGIEDDTENVAEDEELAFPHTRSATESSNTEGSTNNNTAAAVRGVELNASIGSDKLKSRSQQSNVPFISKTKGYLAQHRLFDQVPQLKRDIIVPDYCALLGPEDEVDVEVGGAQAESERSIVNIGDPANSHSSSLNDSDSPSSQTQSNLFRTIAPNGGCATDQSTAGGTPSTGATSDDGDVQMNCWLGPVGTVSPLHHDPYHNLLAQVVGQKYVRLYHPKDSAKLYPMTERMSNNSQVDLTNYDAASFPLVADCDYLETVLYPGDMLFIPRWHWHFITAISAEDSSYDHLRCGRNTDLTSLHQGENETEKEALQREELPEKADHVPVVSPASREADHSSDKNDSDDRPSEGMRPAGKYSPNIQPSHATNYSFSVNFWWGRRILKD